MDNLKEKHRITSSKSLINTDASLNSSQSMGTNNYANHNNDSLPCFVNQSGQVVGKNSRKIPIGYQINPLNQDYISSPESNQPIPVANSSNGRRKGTAVIGHRIDFIAEFTNYSNGKHVRKWIHQKLGDTVKTPFTGNQIIGRNNRIPHATTIEAKIDVPFKIQKLNTKGQVIAQKAFDDDYVKVLSDFKTPIQFSEPSDLTNYADEHWQGYHLEEIHGISKVISNNNQQIPVVWTYVPNVHVVTPMINVEYVNSKGVKITGKYGHKHDVICPKIYGRTGETKLITPADFPQFEGHGFISTDDFATNHFTIKFNSNSVNENPIGNHYTFIYLKSGKIGSIKIQYVNQNGHRLLHNLIKIMGINGHYVNFNRLSVPDGYQLEKKNNQVIYNGQARFESQMVSNLDIGVIGKKVNLSIPVDIITRHKDKKHANQWIIDNVKILYFKVFGRIGDICTVSNLNHIKNYHYDSTSDSIKILLKPNHKYKWLNIVGTHSIPHEYFDITKNLGIIKISYVDSENGNLVGNVNRQSGVINSQFKLDNDYLRTKNEAGNIPNGYVLDKTEHVLAPKSFKSHSQNATIYIKPKDKKKIGVIDVRYENSHGNVSGNENINYLTEAPVGTSFSIDKYEISPYLPTGYKVEKVASPRSYTRKNHIAIIMVTRTKTAINIQYQDDDTHRILGYQHKSALTVVGNDNDKFDVTPYLHYPYVTSGLTFNHKIDNLPKRFVPLKNPLITIHLKHSIGSAIIEYRCKNELVGARLKIYGKNDALVDRDSYQIYDQDDIPMGYHFVNNQNKQVRYKYLHPDILTINIASDTDNVKFNFKDANDNLVGSQKVYGVDGQPINFRNVIMPKGYTINPVNIYGDYHRMSIGFRQVAVSVIGKETTNPLMITKCLKHLDDTVTYQNQIIILNGRVGDTFVVKPKDYLPNGYNLSKNAKDIKVKINRNGQLSANQIDFEYIEKKTYLPINPKFINKNYHSHKDNLIIL